MPLEPFEGTQKKCYLTGLGDGQLSRCRLDNGNLLVEYPHTLTWPHAANHIRRDDSERDTGECRDSEQPLQLLTHNTDISKSRLESPEFDHEKKALLPLVKEPLTTQANIDGPIDLIIAPIEVIGDLQDSMGIVWGL